MHLNLHRKSRRSIGVHLALLIAMVFNLFPTLIPGGEIPTASAHNLDASAIYIFFDPETQAMLDARIAGGWTPGTPLLQSTDELGLIIKALPDNGTTTGVGGYTTFYIPNGIQVVDAAFVAPDGSGGYTRVAAQGQAPMPSVGAGGGPTVNLTGISRGPNILGVTSPIVTAANANLGTLPGVYADTGIFYSTHPSTAFGTYTGGTIRNNSGDTVGLRTLLGTPMNAWDAWQMAGFGIAGTTNPAYPSSPIIDSNGRGTAPWGLANAVAGPQSGYAWEFNYPAYLACTGGSMAPNAACINTATQTVGPWQRIRYPGSQISDDPPGANPPVQPYTRGADASNVGYALSPGNPLPLTTGQSNGTPNAIRWAYGQLTFQKPEFAWLKIKVDNPAGIVNPSGCPEFLLDTFGGDAGGDSNGKDHIWRYYDPNSLVGNVCLMVGKPANRDLVRTGEIIQYQVKAYNLSNFTMNNVVVSDTLPSGVTFLSAVPAQNSGPNPLVWNNVGTLQPGQAFSATVTVRVNQSGMLQNRINVTSNEISVSSSDKTISGLVPLLVPTKSVSPSGVAPGGTVTYTLTISNVGSGPSGNPTRINEYLPTGFTYSSLSSVTVNGALVTGSTTVGGTPAVPVFTVPSGINAGSQLQLVFRAQISPALSPGSYCNTYDVIQNSIRQTTGALACVQVAGGKIGDTIWRDWDGDGVQDAGEEGIAGVTVRLFAANGTTLLATTTTDANGNYYFPGLVAGTYVVEVNSGAPLPGTVQSGDPDQPGVTCMTCDNRHTVNLATDQQYLTADFGYRPTGAGIIGDKVFEDIANDGVFNAGDVGIANVTVWLYEDGNNNGVIDAGDALVATTQSNGSGDYFFNNLATGFNYLVRVDRTDSDIQAFFNIKYGANTPFQLSTPEIIASPNLTGSDLDNDFGFWRTAPSSIGDQVFIDNNGNGIYDSGDAPLANITVTLLRDGEPFRTTVSGPDGSYLFNNLGPGNYTVVVDTADPDLPLNLFASVEQFEVMLTAGQNYLDADFPFTPRLTKTVNTASATAGTVLTFTLKPVYPTTDLLENVRVIDPLPTGTTYVAGSANAGGVFGAYMPLAAENGEDLEGGPLGTTALRSSFTVTPTFVNLGGVVTVTQRITSSVAVTTVTPTELVVNGGVGVCTGPTPASANLSANTGQNFTWTCTLSSTGEYVFSAGAENVLGTYSWPEATSRSVLAAPHGGPNVVTWNLGTNIPGVPGETIVSGYTPGVYALAGANKRDFSKYGTTSGAWTARAQTTNGTEKGGALTNAGSGILYASEGNANRFFRYNITTDTWTALANASDNFNEGGGIQYLNVRGTEYVYAVLGNSNRFRRYNIATNTWTVLAVTPANVKQGGAITTDGTNLYVLQGDGKTGFWRYNVGSDTWTTLASTPANVKWGGALTRVGNFIYAFRGDGKRDFWRYDIANNTWSALALAPGNVGDGGALTTDGAFIYALQGKTKAFWRYTIATNTWTVLAAANFPSNVGQGGSLVYDAGVNPQGRFTTLTALPSLAATGDQVTIELRLQSTAAVTNVVASSLTITPTGGASCSVLTGPVLVTADNNATNIGDDVRYRWVCTVAGSTTPSSLRFSASGTGAGPTAFPAAISRSVLVSPILSFRATVTGSPPPVIRNTGLLVIVSSAPNTFPSNTTQTGTTGSIGDRVWNDTDGNGIQNVGEAGLAGVRVYIDSNNNGVWDVGEPNAITDALGAYRIFNLGAGTYIVRTDPSTYPAGYIPTTSQVLSVNLASGQQFDDADFGLKPAGTGRIGDTIWLDANNNGIQDAGELGIRNITVTLQIDINGVWTTLSSTTTDASGKYTFTGLIADNYRVTVNTSSQITSPYASGTFSLGSVMTPTYDLDGVGTPHVALVTLATDSTVVDTVDFGYNWSGSIGDYVWWDDNLNGVQDEAANRGIFNARVQLYFDKDGDGVLDLVAGDFEILRVFTNANGYYLIPNLPPGKYIVDVYEDSLVTNGVRDVVPTTADNIPVTLAPGNMSFMNADFGYFVGARIESLVFWDEDSNGLFEGAEQRLAGVTVTVTGTDTLGNPVTRTGVSSSTGNVVFLIPPGDYTISYNPAQVTSLYPALGTQTTPTSFSFTAIAGEDGWQRFDFGVDNTGAIGDRVWNDANNNGVQETGESGLGGVTVSLYRDNNNNGVLDGGDTFLAAQVTSGTGNYLFTGLPDGNYITVVNTATLPAGFVQTFDNFGALDHTGKATLSGGNTVLTVDFGYRAATTVYTISGRVYNDQNNNGDWNTGEPGFPGVDVTVICTQLGTVSVQTDANGNWSVAGIPQGAVCSVLDADENDLPRNDYAATETPSTPFTVNGNITDLDFGYNQRPGSISGTVCVSPSGLLGVGPCDDGNETPLQGITVTLTYAGDDGILGTADDATLTATTSITGFYSFSNLEPGLYRIAQTVLPNYSSLGDRDGGNPNVISPVNLTLGQNRTGQNFEVALNIEARDDSYTTSVNTPITATVSVNDTYPPGSTFITTTVPSNGTVNSFNPTDGTFTYTPNPGFTGTDSFTYQVCLPAPNQTICDTATVTIRILDTSFVVTKTLNTPSPVRTGETISFTIRITNTGNVTLTTLPLRDTYTTFFLAYVGATPLSDDNVSDGSIDWSDLTAPAPNGFGVDLAPGAAFSVVVNFIAIADTTGQPGSVTTNTALVTGAFYDADGPGGLPPQGPLPDRSATATVGVIAPTSVLLADYGVTAGEAVVDVNWQTVDESNIAYFDLYRIEAEASTLVATISAERAGQSGGQGYTYTDSGVIVNVWYSYRLDLVQLDGSVLSMELGSVYTGGVRLFLPRVSN
ncbi:MAG: carboxypeptidase regulatory-like domain-containing protein [Caldilineaceae bacterium]|nr:carboxypeptidase regulatory-like domain-containing protein [Caldilineaceae bacterium]